MSRKWHRLFTKGKIAATTIESHKMAAIFDIKGWQRHAALVYHVFLEIWHQVIINWHLPNQVIRRPVSPDHIAAQVYSSSRSRVLFKLTADQVLVFDLIARSCQVNCWKLSRTDWKPVNSNPDLKVNQIITVSSLRMFFFLFTAFVLFIGFAIINLKYIEG